MNVLGLIAGTLAGSGAVVGCFEPATQAGEPPAAAQPAPVATPAAAPAADPSAEFVTWAADQKAAIETITGAKFDRDVSIKVVSTDEMAQMVGKSIEGDMVGSTRPNGTPMSAMEIHVRATAAAFKVATRTFGMYRYEDKTVYVVPENARTFAKRHGWSDLTVARTPRLALAHELIHALQDQKVALSERSAKLNREHQFALRAVSEGHAVWATDQLAKQLDWGAANSVLWGVVTGVQTEEEPTKGAPAVVAPPRIAPSAETYSVGKAFIEFQMAWTGEGPKGTERVWTILKTPPTNMGQLADPGSFEVKPAAPPAPPAPGATGTP
jgi:hypothetical protein